jgi:hypothetical protein
MRPAIGIPVVQVNPGEPARPLEVPEGILPEDMHAHHQDHAVGGIAMQAAHHTAQIPLVMGQPLDRLVGRGRAGIEEDVEVNPTDRDDPVIEEAERAQLIERVPTAAETGVQAELKPVE